MTSSITDPTSAYDAISADELRRRPGMKWSRFGPDVLPSFVAEMDFATAPEVQEAISGGVADYAYGYLPVALGRELGEATARWYSTHYDWNVDPALVRPLADVLTALEAVIGRFSTPGSPVIVPTPAYMPFLLAPTGLDREIVRLPMDDVDGRYLIHLDALDAAFAAGAEVLVLCNPHNPTGTVYTAAELAQIAEVANRHRAVVFSDEIHAAIRYGAAAHVPYASLGEHTARHTITATSASKAWNLPGMKCASIIFSNPEHLDVWTPHAYHLELGASTLGVIANVAALRHGERWLDGVLAYLDGSRHLLAELLAEQLPDVRYRPPDGTYLAWLDVGALDLGELPVGPAPRAMALLDRGKVAVTDGEACGAPGFVRLNMATPRPILRELVERIAAAVERR